MKKLVPKHPRAAEFVAQGLYTVNSFKELEAKISALESKDERGAAFEVFAEAFLVTQEGIDPDNLWPQGTEPHALRNELGLPRDDFGIDGIYLNQSGQYDPYQCKFRNGRPTLGWQDLATFVALASNDKFANKVLFTNCEYVAPILRGRVVLIRGSRLDQLSRNDLAAMRELAMIRQKRLKVEMVSRQEAAIKVGERIAAELERLWWSLYVQRAEEIRAEFDRLFHRVGLDQNLQDAYVPITLLQWLRPPNFNISRFSPPDTKITKCRQLRESANQLAEFERMNFGQIAERLEALTPAGGIVVEGPAILKLTRTRDLQTVPGRCKSRNHRDKRLRCFCPQ